MSFQWSIIAGYLYMEIAFVIILLLPIASPRKWRRFFQSRLWDWFREKAVFYFYTLLGLLSLFLVDAIREMRKYSRSTVNGSHAHLTSEMKDSIKLFRAQRNFYITGFAIFLAFVLKRLINMIIIQAELLEKSEQIVRSAAVANQLAQTTVLANQHNAGDADDSNEVRNKLAVVESLLEQERKKVESLEVSVNCWKKKYEETASSKNLKSE